MKTVNLIPSSVISINGVFAGCNKLGGKLSLGSDITSCNALRELGDKTLTLVVEENSTTEKMLDEYLLLKSSWQSNIKIKNE